MQNRIAVIGIIVGQRENAAKHVNAVLSEHANIIVGRMGIPTMNGVFPSFPSSLTAPPTKSVPSPVSWATSPVLR